MIALAELSQSLEEERGRGHRKDNYIVLDVLLLELVYSYTTVSMRSSPPVRALLLSSRQLSKMLLVDFTCHPRHAAATPTMPCSIQVSGTTASLPFLTSLPANHSPAISH